MSQVASDLEREKLNNVTRWSLTNDYNEMDWMHVQYIIPCVDIYLTFLLLLLWMKWQFRRSLPRQLYKSERSNKINTLWHLIPEVTNTPALICLVSFAKSHGIDQKDSGCYNVKKIILKWSKFLWKNRLNLSEINNLDFFLLRIS